MNSKIDNIVSDEEISESFRYTNFGTLDDRTLLECSVFKKLVGYHCGHTITTIMKELNLIGSTGVVTKKGKKFVAEAFSDLMKNSG